MAQLRKEIAVQFEKFQSHLKKAINSYPTFERTLTKVRSTTPVRFLSVKAKKSQKHIELIFKDLPSDLKSVKPYLKVQRENFKAWGENLKSKVASERTVVKRKIKSRRLRV